MRFLAEFRSDRGVQAVQAEATRRGLRAEIAFAETLHDALQQLAKKSPISVKDLPILVSGMATSSIGWLELPYGRVPLALDGSNVPSAETQVTTEETGVHRVVLLSGLCTDDDVMRGEETEVLGLLSCPEYTSLRSASLLILPGTHSKHVEIQNGQIEGFRTYMTGELFSVLGTHSILRHSLGAPGLIGSTGEASSTAVEAFVDGVRAGSRSALCGALFKVRTNQVLKQLGPAENREYLSGLLIGSELADAYQTAAGRPTWLAASPPLQSAYSQACETLGLDVLQVPEAITRSASARGQWCCYSAAK